MSDDFGDMLAQFETDMQAATVKRVREVAEDLLAGAQAVVPYQEGDLSRSGHVTVKELGVGAQSEVNFDIVYARYQELREDLTHQDQGQAHYLGGTLKSNAQRYMDHLSGVWDDLG
ncbi:hypothetical protein [Saccharothrix stipae]